MSPFEHALIDESRYLAVVLDQPMPTDSRAGRRTYIGPTALDMSAVPEVDRLRSQIQHEQQVLSDYRKQDSRSYLGNRSIRR